MFIIKTSYCFFYKWNIVYINLWFCKSAGLITFIRSQGKHCFCLLSLYYKFTSFTLIKPDYLIFLSSSLSSQYKIHTWKKYTLMKTTKCLRITLNNVHFLTSNSHWFFDLSNMFTNIMGEKRDAWKKMKII